MLAGGRSFLGRGAPAVGTANARRTIGAVLLNAEPAHAHQTPIARNPAVWLRAKTPNRGFWVFFTIVKRWRDHPAPDRAGFAAIWQISLKPSTHPSESDRIQFNEFDHPGPEIESLARLP
jgi:hypothetical protein